MSRKSKEACECTIAVIELEMQKDLPLSFQVYLEKRKQINKQIMQDENLLRTLKKKLASKIRKNRSNNNKPKSQRGKAIASKTKAKELVEN